MASIPQPRHCVLAFILIACVAPAGGDVLEVAAPAQRAEWNLTLPATAEWDFPHILLYFEGGTFTAEKIAVEPNFPCVSFLAGGDVLDVARDRLPRSGGRVLGTASAAPASATSTFAFRKTPGFSLGSKTHTTTPLPLSLLAFRSSETFFPN